MWKPAFFCSTTRRLHSPPCTTHLACSNGANASSPQDASRVALNRYTNLHTEGRHPLTMGMARNRALNHMSARPWKTPRLLATRHAHATARAALTLWSNAARHPPLPPAHRQQFGEHAQRPSRAKRGDHATVRVHALPRSRASPRLVRAALLSPARRPPPPPSPAANGRAVGSQKAWVRGPVGWGWDRLERVAGSRSGDVANRALVKF